MISINKDNIRIQGDAETIGAEFMILSNTIRKRYGFKLSDLAFFIRCAADLEDKTEATEAQSFTIVLCKGREIFNMGN